jgi:hypothetical protein
MSCGIDGNGGGPRRATPFASLTSHVIETGGAGRPDSPGGAIVPGTRSGVTDPGRVDPRTVGKGF